MCLFLFVFFFYKHLYSCFVPLSAQSCMSVPVCIKHGILSYDLEKRQEYRKKRLQKNICIHIVKVLDSSIQVVKVADFGVARVQAQSGVMTAETGTYRWMAPEVCIFR